MRPPRPFEPPPSPWIERHAARISGGGRVLDLAAGGGRHTRLLLERGYAVVAVDRDTGALEAAFAGHPDCRIVGLDLENGEPWRLGAGYDGIVVANYLYRPLFVDLAAALTSGGVLIYETFMLGNEAFGKPSNPDFLLRPNELIEAFAPRLMVLAFEQGIVQRPRPAAIQRLVATKGGIIPLD
ncbi:MAG: class I SAM-dependent methyltransferase [Alphaproteobacteria bacterium]|nr:class I SAM-dependent methyltransferase [Alphaproteobacteria bacterium]